MKIQSVGGNAGGVPGYVARCTAGIFGAYQVRLVWTGWMSLFS